ncbi:collagen alpha-5 chain [Rhypophila decipiens]|uniref:Collagen alpha-5 chain n=1 Tax=Rhypophila decipiens TaxID=261697 RepID=A0AAN6XV23_9PEZI|nr:collagen alpha-5 chain [Rhypophila decipiens]
MSSSNRRSFFGSVKDKISRKPSFTKSSSSVNSNTGSAPVSPVDSSIQSQRSALTPSRNPFAGALAAGTASDGPPPPSYNEATSPSAAAAPSITVNPPTSSFNRSTSPAPSGASAISQASLSTPEDPYAFLSTFDTMFLIDDSGSMAGSSWREVKEALRAITPICTAHDADGIDVFFLNSKNPAHSDGAGFPNVRGPEQVEALFNRVRPHGGTPTGTRLNQILKPYLREYERKIAMTGDPDNSGVNPVNMIVITDGVPTDDPESVIVSIAKKLDKLEAPPYQVGIQFFQVGKEPGAAEALKELDDNLAEQHDGIRDIVDTVTWNKREGGAGGSLSADAILKVVLGAVVKRLDRRRTSGESRRRAPGALAP